MRTMCPVSCGTGCLGTANRGAVDAINTRLGYGIGSGLSDSYFGGYSGE